jgi:hypothetical protein
MIEPAHPMRVGSKSWLTRADVNGFAARRATVDAVARIRAALAGLGYAAALMLFIVFGYATWYACNDFNGAALVQQLAWVLSAAVPFGMALVLPLLIVVASANLAPPAGVRRALFIAMTTLLAITIAHAWAPVLASPALDDTPPKELSVLVVLLVLVLELRHRTQATAGLLLRTEIDAIAAHAQLRQAHLGVLHAQIAPHFLFNTLANVRRLARVDRAAATSMLADLALYFSITLAQRDATTATLADEAELVDAYLRIHRVRMGERLSYAVRLPADLRDARLPPMMLLTLVENAIKHGVDPLVEGGRVEIIAARQGTTLRVEVPDNGRGLASAEGTGLGLANIRARLSMLYGARATLGLAQRRPRGFVASLQLPLEYAQ